MKLLLSILCIALVNFLSAQDFKRSYPDIVKSSIRWNLQMYRFDKSITLISPQPKLEYILTGNGCRLYSLVSNNFPWKIADRPKHTGPIDDIFQA